MTTVMSDCNMLPTGLPLTSSLHSLSMMLVPIQVHHLNPAAFVWPLHCKCYSSCYQCAGTLDAQASGKLSRAKLDNAMAGMAADYAAVRAKSRTLSPEQESAFGLRAAAAQVCPHVMWPMPAGSMTSLCCNSNTSCKARCARSQQAG